MAGGDRQKECIVIELKNDSLVFRFPEVHPGAMCGIEFQRTLRIPDDNRVHGLPPGLGRFPMEHVDDHASRVPSSWIEHGGTMLPMYQAEALWVRFSVGSSEEGVGYPFAVKIAAGKINAITGKPWTNGLSDAPQDYVVLPGQPWLDGFNVSEGLIRQFVAMPLGRGYTAEEQLTGLAEHGGIQVIVYPMRRDRYQKLVAEARERRRAAPADMSIYFCCESVNAYGLAPGGLMKQNIYDDPYGLSAWDTTQPNRCFVHILNSEQWRTTTGKPVPTSPVTAKQYTDAGLPWFDVYDEGAKALPGSTSLAGLDSVAAKAIKLGDPPLVDNDPVEPKKVITLAQSGLGVSDGKW